MRKIKRFSGTNSDYVYLEFQKFIEENQNIKVEHLTSFSTGHTTYIIILYFE